MKTPHKILLEHAPVFQQDFDDTLMCSCILAMQAYADQQVNRVLDKAIKIVKSKKILIVPMDDLAKELENLKLKQ